MTNEEIVYKFQNGDDAAFEELLKVNKGIIHFMINKWFSAVSQGKLTMSELESEAEFGFFLAAKNYQDYQDNKGQSFSTYAFNRIQWRIFRQVESMQKLTKDGTPVHLCSLDDPISGTDDMKIEDNIPDDIDIENDSIEKLSKEVDYPKILEAVNNLDGRSRDVIIRRYYQNRSLESVSSELSVSAERTRQIEKKALKILGKMDSVKNIARESYNWSTAYAGSFRRFKEMDCSCVEDVVLRKIECEEKMHDLNNEVNDIFLKKVEVS